MPHYNFCYGSPEDSSEMIFFNEKEYSENEFADIMKDVIVKVAMANFGDKFAGGKYNEEVIEHHDCFSDLFSTLYKKISEEMSNRGFVPIEPKISFGVSGWAYLCYPKSNHFNEGDKTKELQTLLRNEYEKKFGNKVFHCYKCNNELLEGRLGSLDCDVCENKFCMDCYENKIIIYYEKIGKYCCNECAKKLGVF